MTTHDRIRVLIVDDEPLARDSLRILLREDREIDVVGECGNGADAVTAIHALAPDLLFLDIQMPEIDGFEVLREVGVGRIPAVVFVTAFDAHAIRAFEHHALDYLLKPFTDERFAATLRRAKAQVRREQIGHLSRRLAALLDDAGADPSLRSPSAAEAPADRLRSEAGERYRSRLVIRSGGRVSLVAVDMIDWIESADYYVRIHAGRQAHLLRESMHELERSLDPNRFFRVHRSAIVNLERVRVLEPWFRGDYLVVLQDGTKVRLSRRRRERLASLLGQRF